MTDKQFTIEYNGYGYFNVIDMESRVNRLIAQMDTMKDAKTVVELLEIFTS